MIRPARVEADKILQGGLAKRRCQGATGKNECLRGQENNRRVAVLMIGRRMVVVMSTAVMRGPGGVWRIVMMMRTGAMLVMAGIGLRHLIVLVVSIIVMMQRRIHQIA